MVKPWVREWYFDTVCQMRKQTELKTKNKKQNPKGAEKMQWSLKRKVYTVRGGQAGESPEQSL